MQSHFTPIRLRQRRGGFLPRLLAALALSAALGVAQAAPPRFDTASQRLSAPLVKIGESVYPDVEIEFAGDGTWKVVKAGAGRPLRDGDVPDAELDPLANTFSVARLHIGGNVYDKLQLDLGAATWALKGAPQPMRALVEDDFAGDAQLEATLDHVVMLNLEAPGASSDAADSGGSGTDSFPLRLQAGDYQFCFDKQDDGADTLNLRDERGNLLLTLKSGDPCTQLTLDTGRYTGEVRYGGVSGKVHPVFVRKQQPGGQAFAYDFGNAFVVAFGADCNDCDLRDALYLSFPGWGRQFFGARMDGIRFIGAELSYARFSNASLARAQIIGSNLKNARLISANLRDAVIENTSLAGAALNRADLRGARLTNVDLTGAQLGGATWIDGRKCAEYFEEKSIGKCD